MKRFIAYVVVCLLSVMLTACGFHLRGTKEAQIDIKDMSVSAGDRYGTFVKELRERLKQEGVQVHDDAIYKLSVTEHWNSRNVSFSNSMRGNEIERILDLKFRIHGTGNLLLVEESVEARGVYNNDTNNIVGSELEEERINAQVRSSAIDLMMYRLQAISSADLEKLQQAAEEQIRLKAEAEQLEAKALEQRRKALMQSIPTDIIELRNQE